MAGVVTVRVQAQASVATSGVSPQPPAHLELARAVTSGAALGVIDAKRCDMLVKTGPAALLAIDHHQLGKGGGG